MKTGDDDINSAAKKETALKFGDIFNLDEIQQLQDLFSDATGVASIITHPDGTPITKPSHFCRLCEEIIRKTGKGLSKCYLTAASHGLQSASDRTSSTCLIAGLQETGTIITVGGRHIANWMIGQVRNEDLDEVSLNKYADEIGANREDFMAALNEVPVMSTQQFDKISKMLAAFARGISEKAYHNKLLKESEAKFQNLFMNMAEGAALHKLTYNDQGIPNDYIIIEINPAFERTLGISRETVIGKTGREAYSVGEPPYFDVYLHVATTGQPVKFESYFPPLDKYFTISVYCPSLGNFATVFQDISERKKSEQLLSISLTKYQKLFDIFPVGITISDSLGNIIETNKITENLLGISRDEHESRSISGEEWTIVRADGTPMPVEEYASVRALKEQTQVDNVEMGIFKSDDRVTWINVSAAPLALDGYGVVITYHDITEKKLAEKVLRETNAYLENLINYANAPIIVWDTQFRITRFNHAFEFLTGWLEADVIGQPLEILFPPEQVERYMELIRKTFSGERWESVEIEILNLDQSINTVLWNSATIFTPDGQTPIATIAQGQNITMRKKVEEELQNVNATLEQRIAERTHQLETINRELSFHLREIEQFTYIATHDLQEPLNTLKNFTRLIHEEYAGRLDDDGNNYIDFINKSATRMSELVTGLLEYSLLGKESERTMVDCNQVVAMVLDDIADSIKMNDTVITVNELPRVYGFATELRLLFQNLINNAIKFSKREIRPEVTVSAESLGTEWLFTIKDNGIGIGEKDYEKIFVIFKRMQNRSDYEGTGIGLAHCKKIVELHGGKIWVESVIGTGSAFRFTIPFAE